jgi:hypothetical protein
MFHYHGNKTENYQVMKFALKQYILSRNDFLLTVRFCLKLNIAMKQPARLLEFLRHSIIIKLIECMTLCQNIEDF